MFFPLKEAPSFIWPLHFRFNVSCSRSSFVIFVLVQSFFYKDDPSFIVFPGTLSFHFFCFPGEIVCVLRPKGVMEIFHLYGAVLEEFGVKIPFTLFEMDVLRLLNVAPTQIRPNSWALKFFVKHWT